MGAFETIEDVFECIYLYHGKIYFDFDGMKLDYAYDKSEYQILYKKP